ncbi:hypothetical protein ASE40_03920 [Flavobacterium sp. Root935]|nr:hypothetical protein ASE40_03920 [Flavobacterium sp. Root935]MDQ1168162.1 magnesium-transporting ATPase (P-type) [Flavobacterium sp. SORGH_AS_0622]BDU24222.1 hypothetical protein FLGSB24_09660 [Flavobacterium sp. GSB-24]
MDNSKKIILHLVIRIGILILLLGLVFLFWHFTYDPHKLCDENGHKHVDGGLGFFIMLFLITQMFYLGLLIEMIYLFVKKQRILAFANLGFLIISLCIVSICMFLIN